MSKKRKMVLALTVLALLAPAGWAGVSAVWGPADGPRYHTARVERGAIATSVSATGTLNPVVTVQVSTQVSGKLAELYADFNTVVHAGQPLAQLDPTTLRAKLTETEAQLENARAEVKNTMANVQNVRAAIDDTRAEAASQQAQVERAHVAVMDAKRALDRHHALFERQLLARSERDAAQTNYDSAMAQRKAAEAQVVSAEAKMRMAQAQLRAAEAQVEKAQAQVSQVRASAAQAKVELERTVIRSPISGVVISRNVDVGQTVAASLQAPTLFSIAQDLMHMQVDAYVSEADIGSITPGQPVTFTVDAYPGQPFRGTVRAVRLAPIVVQNVVNYDTVITVENPDLRLKPGMTATVSILVAQRSAILKVPKAALRFQPPLSVHERGQLDSGGRERQRGEAPTEGKPSAGALRKPGQAVPTVWLPTPEGPPQPVAVRLGLSDDQYTEVTDESLREGVEVIVGVHGKDGPGAVSMRPPSPPSGPRLQL